MANHEETEWEWQGKKFKAAPGQMVTSLENIAKEAGKGISIQNVRTAIDKFEKYGFLTNQSTKTGRLITVLNWELYQSKKENQQSNKQRANKEVTTNNNDKNEINIYKDIVEYLNQKASTNYKHTSKITQKHINGRLSEGYTLDDFKKVIDKKVTEWNHEPKDNEKDMRPYLRPETLFGTKFESYLNQQVKQPQQSKQNKFNAHEQRAYTDQDYAELEKKLLRR
jgi:uncharacterized phage protein (TIGR02220 family)